CMRTGLAGVPGSGSGSGPGPGPGPGSGSGSGSGLGCPPPAGSSAPMEMLDCGLARATSPPMASLLRSGGSLLGTSSGPGKGKPDGDAGALVPAPINGLPEAGRRLRAAMSVKLGLVPRTVPVHSLGTRVADDCTQLLLPATRLPELHGSLPKGSQ